VKPAASAWNGVQASQEDRLHAQQVRSQAHGLGGVVLGHRACRACPAVVSLWSCEWGPGRRFSIAAARARRLSVKTIPALPIGTEDAPLSRL
jgi:hypothetical protein